MQANIRPDYHYLLIAPNLGAEWLFGAARNYVLAFRPILLADRDFVALTPPNTLVTVTVIARRDTAPQIGVELAQVNPYAFYDPVVRDTFEETQAELDRRATANEPFGVPLGVHVTIQYPDTLTVPENGKELMLAAIHRYCEARILENRQELRYTIQTGLTGLAYGMLVSLALSTFLGYLLLAVVWPEWIESALTGLASIAVWAIVWGPLAAIFFDWLPNWTAIRVY